MQSTPQQLQQMIMETGVLIIPVAIGLTAIFKQFKFPNRFLPLLNIAWGIIGELLFFADIKLAILAGFVIGLSASGLYRTVKVTGKGE